MRTCCALGMVPKRQGACSTGITLNPLPSTTPRPDSLLPQSVTMSAELLLRVLQTYCRYLAAWSKSSNTMVRPICAAKR